jgi:maltooligosyltrehalose synthase
VFAYARRLGNAVAITCVPRLVATLSPDAATPLVGAVWGDTRIVLPEQLAGASWGDAFTSSRIEPEPVDGRPTLAAAAVFAHLPVSLLS